MFARLFFKEELKGIDMLVLSRHKNESVIINNSIEVTVVEIRGDKVRLGIQADKGIPVNRKEVQIAIDAQAASALEARSNAV